MVVAKEAPKHIFPFSIWEERSTSILTCGDSDSRGGHDSLLCQHYNVGSACMKTDPSCRVSVGREGKQTQVMHVVSGNTGARRKSFRPVSPGSESA